MRAVKLVSPLPAVCYALALVVRSHLAAQCTNEVMCRNCKQSGHIAGQCTNEAVCNICNKPGHLAFGCASSRINSGLPKSQVRHSRSLRKLWVGACVSVTLLCLTKTCFIV